MKNKKYHTGIPRVEFYDYLGHHFVFVDRYNIRIYECDKCNVEVFIQIEHGILQFPIYSTDLSLNETDNARSYYELSLNCEEIQIKKLLE